MTENPLEIWQERMAPHMLKVHLPQRHIVLHDFTAPDGGHHHDHPWPFESLVIDGGYTEEVLRPDGSTYTIHRWEGDRFEVKASHVHRIISLDGPWCMTRIKVLAAAERKTGFYQYTHGQGMLFRFHDSEEWIPGADRF